MERQVLVALRKFVDDEFKTKKPLSVELLKIKNSTIIKHFKKLRGVTFIVAETYKDYVRIYFFLPQGMLLGADNFPHEKYEKARKEARLLYRLAKPEEPTEADLYLEATEQVFKKYTKILKRVQRTLNLKILNNPVVFISKTPLNEENSLFGTTRTEERVIFEEKYIDMPLIEGLMIREAFRSLCPQPIVNSQLCIELGNFVALKMISKEEKENWRTKWQDNSVNYEISTHLIRHEYTYGFPNIAELVTHIKGISPNIIDNEPYKILEAFHALHYIRNENVAFMIDDAINDFSFFTNKRNFELANAIHLSPRIIINYKALGKSLCITTEKTDKFELKIKTMKNEYYIKIIDNSCDDEITKYTHNISFRQVMPKKDGWALTQKIRGIFLRKTLGISFNPDNISKTIEFKPTTTSISEDILEILNTINNSGIITTSQSKILEEAKIANHAQLFLTFHHVIPQPNIFLMTQDPKKFKYLAENILNIIPESHLYHMTHGGFALIHIPIEWWHHIIQNMRDINIELIYDVKSKGPLFHQPDKNPNDERVVT